MFIAAIFWLFMLATCALVVVYGDRDARLLICVLVGSAILTLVVRSLLAKPDAAVVVLGVDALVLATALWMVSRSNSYWPIWYAGFLLIDVSTMVAWHIFPQTLRSVYNIAAGSGSCLPGRPW